MPSAVGSITRAATKDKNKPLNIISGVTHERYESLLSRTNATFYAFGHESFKPYWNENYGKIPDNYIQLDKNLGDRQIPNHLDFDLVLSQNKFGQFQILSQIARQLHLPIISLEHTLPVPNWPQDVLQNTQSMRGDYNVFISEYSIDKWGWDRKNNTQVIRHALDTNVFVPGNLERQNHILTVANDYIGRDWCKPAGQKILTNNGYVNIEKIEIGDMVLTDSGFFNRVIDTTERDYYGPMVFITVDGYKTEIAFTPTHNIRVFRNGQWQYIDSVRLKDGDKLKFPELKQTEFYETSTDYAYLIGSIIADGSITNKGCIEMVVEIEDVERIDKLMTLYKKYIGTPNKSNRDRETKNVIKISATTKILGNWLKEKIGGKSYEKSIPDFLFNSTQEVKLATLRGLWDCDGSFKSGQNDRLCYSTISIKLASQVSALLHNFGVRCTIKKERRITNKSNGEIKWIYRVVSQEKENIDRCKSLILNNEDNKYPNEQYNYHVKTVRIDEEWKGKVYNCTVNEDPSYVVYPGFVAHNCLNFKQYQQITKDLPVYPRGDTQGFSLPTKNVEELVQCYQSSLLFLNTAHISPIPMSLLEAMSCGCACVSVNASEIPYYISHGFNGYLYNTVEEARLYINLVMNDKNLAKELGQNARETILKECQEERFINEWNNLFNLASKIIYKG